MKHILFILTACFILSCANGKDRYFTGSTPAGKSIRPFLGIPVSDSIDFIRWKLTINDQMYILSCNYGIGKPNTNGFINGGKTINAKGKVKREGNFIQLLFGSEVLNLFEVNDNLLYLLNDDKTLIVGNGGWSYVLNNQSPLSTSEVNLKSRQTVFKDDSMVFEGRTPCTGLQTREKECYKLKWLLVLYVNRQTNQPAGFSLKGTGFREQGGKKGNWKIIAGKNGSIIYQLDAAAIDDKTPLYLLKLDDKILYFIEANGNLMVGNEDFSYALNRR